MSNIVLFLKNLLFIVIAPGTIAVYFPLMMVGERSTASGMLLAGSLVLLAIGGIAYLWCVWDFAAHGRGTPAPIDPPKRLVIRGLYRFSRNPMYTAVLTTIVGWAVLFTAPILLAYGFGVGVACQAFVVLYEEPHLRKVFGRPYDEYCARVGRWFPRCQKSRRT